MPTDPTMTDHHVADQLLENALARDKYLKSRLQQIRIWNMSGWLLWVLLAILCYWLYEQKPLYLNPTMLAGQVEMGGMPTNEVLQLAALGSLMFWGFIALLAGFIFQIYTAMYSERKLIRLIESVHLDDLARHQSVDSKITDSESNTL